MQKNLFSAGGPGGPILAPNGLGSNSLLTGAKRARYGGLGDQLNDLEVETSVDKVPSELVFEPRSPRYGQFLSLVLHSQNSADFGPSTVICQPFVDISWS